MSSTNATYIRDQAYNRLLKIPGWKSTRRTPIPTLTPDGCPALGVFLIRENMTPDGDENVLEPRYISEIVVGITVTDLASKPDVLEGSVDTLIGTIMDTLLTDGSFVSLVSADGTTHVIESIPNISRTYQFPNTAETYFLECRLQMTIRFRVHFQPLAPNAFIDVSVDVRPFDDKVAIAPKYVINLPQ